MTAAVMGMALLGVVLVAPRVVRLDEAPPALAAATWFSALVARAGLTIVAAAGVIVAVPSTSLFETVSGWCWHTILPVIAAHLGFNGHSLADAAILLPTLLLAVSTVSVGFGLWRAARRVARLLKCGFGPGPRDSIIIRDGTVVVAAAGLRRPRVVVSAGALAALDDAELYASLEHERGHIVHRHRWAMLVGTLCRAIGWFIPGGRAALSELAFHLERDADRFAIDHHHEPRTLASAICKAAAGGSLGVPPATSLAGSGVVRRVSQLLGDGPTRAGSSRLSRVIAAVTVASALILMAAVPPTTWAALQSGGTVAVPDCPH